MKAAYNSDGIFSAIVNSLTQQIAVVNEDGNLEWVNKAWIEFSKENGGKPDKTWRGTNYMKVCRQSADSGDADAISALKGLRDVIDGRKQLFYMEYPCHSSTEKRWFMMQVRPLDWEESRHFVVSHQNITERKLIEEKIQEFAILDALTEMPNRRYFNYFLDEEWRRAQRLQHPVSLILFDIDCFKPFNDNYGHMAGDECLKKVGAALNEVARRPGDLAARYGGEEFAIILGNTDAEGAMEIAEKARATVYDLNIPHEFCTASMSVTISAGVATAQPASGSSQNALIEAADNGLYAAKKRGRNRVSIHKTFFG